MAGVEIAGGVGGGGGGVFDVLGLVEDDEVKFLPLQFFAVAGEEGVAGDDEVVVFDLLERGF